MSIIEFEIKNPRKKLEFYEQLHKENITRIEKLRKEKKQLKEVIDEVRKYTKKEIEFNERQIEAYKTCINTNVYGEFSKETKENMGECITLSIGICWKMKELLQILDKVKV